MKKFAFIISFFVLAVSGYSATLGIFTLAEKSYIQRGVLKFDDMELPITVYVVSKNGESKMLLESRAGRLAKLELARDGELLNCEVGALFTRSIAENFALRDMRAALGFLEKLDSSIRLTSENNKVKTIEDGDYYKMEFLNYTNLDGVEIPRRLKISDENYSLDLEFVAFIERK